MKIRVWLLGLLVGVLPFCSCNDDSVEERKINNTPFRVKRITGENKNWGQYELQFNYRSDGLVEKVWRFGNIPYTEIRDTMGDFSVEYDVDYHYFQVTDRVLNIKEDSINSLKKLYPEHFADSIKSRFRERTLFTSTLSEGVYSVSEARPPLDVWGEYINVSAQTLMIENREDGKPLIIRSYDDVPGMGGDNGEYERTVHKYEFDYAGDEVVEAIVYTPDSYNVSSWSALWKISFSHYSDVLTGVESDDYKMRRSGNTVVVAEPGVNTTYTLNEYGLAIKMENTNGEFATIEYESGSGNFSDLYATPLDKVLL